MAVSETEIQVTWSASNSVSVSAGGNATSDAITFDETAVARQIQLKADNASAATSGDTITFRLLQSLGDPDGASTDEYESVGHGLLLGVLDTNTDDPAGLVVPIPETIKSGKIYAVSGAASNSITVSATVLEKRSA